MTEQGLVVKVQGDYATIRVDKKDECSKCGMCVFGKNVNYVEFSAKNTLNAVEGDKVTFTKQEKGKLLASLLVFFVPLMLIVISSLIGALIIKKEIWILILSLITIVIWYTILAIIDKRLKFASSFSAEIISIDRKPTENDIKGE